MSFELMRHQRDAVNRAVINNGKIAFFHDIGCGKTLTALATFSDFRNFDPHLKLLIVCPLSLVRDVWIREIEKFYPQYNWFDLRLRKRKHPHANTDIHIINYESLLTNNFKRIYDLIAEGENWMCVADESSRLKNAKSRTVKKLLELRKYFKYRIVMSGTPAPNIEWEYWPQMEFVDPAILGMHFYKFKNIYFTLSRGNENLPPGIIMNSMTLRKMHEQGFKYSIVPQKRDELFERMRPWCHQINARDCMDLPEETNEYRRIRMSERQEEVYHQMKRSYIAEIREEKFIVANVILAKIMKLRQITSGFAINVDGEELPIGTKNPKIEELLALIDECGKEQMIIWCQFHWEMDQVEKILTDRGECVSLMHGRVPEKHRYAHIENFLNGRNRFLVAHPKSAGHGLTLTNCHISVFFSMDYSNESYIQARGRIYRKGQRTNCLYFHLIAENSIDEDILEVVLGKKTTEEMAKKYFNELKS